MLLTASSVERNRRFKTKNVLVITLTAKIGLHLKNESPTCKYVWKAHRSDSLAGRLPRTIAGIPKTRVYANIKPQRCSSARQGLKTLAFYSGMLLIL